MMMNNICWKSLFEESAEDSGEAQGIRRVLVVNEEVAALVNE